MKITALQIAFLTAALSPLLCAQVPYEYFDFREITPPSAAGYVQDSPASSSGDSGSLSLDQNTGIGGDLSLYEPFSPPVGIYKRLQVLSETRQQQGTLQFTAGSPDNCEEIQAQPANSKYPLHRSAVLEMNLSTEITRLPSDSPEMRVTSITAFPLNSDNGRVSLFKCGDEHYFVAASKPGNYRIEYETASPPDAAVPKTADFFSQVFPNPDHTMDISPENLDLIDNHPQLGLIRHSAHPISELIRFFQGFESASLTKNPLQRTESPLERDIIEAILAEKKGICRHRSFLFTWIANAWGYPARIIVNEAHAFVEIEVSGRWYPVELGGRGQSLTVTSSNTSSKTPPIQSSNSFTGQSGHWVSSGFKIRYYQYPVKALRNQPLSLSGVAVASSGYVLSNRTLSLVITHPLGGSLTSEIRTDEEGTFSIRLSLPKTWPVGKSELKWFLLQNH